MGRVELLYALLARIAADEEDASPTEEVSVAASGFLLLGIHMLLLLLMFVPPKLLIAISSALSRWKL